MASDKFQTPFSNPVAPTPSPADSNLGGTRGGYPLKDGKQETPDSLGTRPTTIDVRDANVGIGDTVEMPDLSGPHRMNIGE
jgi:hypothetical protein